MPHILIVEDEAAIADTLVYALQADGHSTEWVTLGSAALDQQRQRPADLVILDIGLPDISGFETCRQLRRFTEVPVMFLSARDGEIDRVVGLEIGADDYVVKPFSPREVAARVRAILKRMAPRAEVVGETTLFQLDTLRMQITYRSQPLTLTRWVQELGSRVMVLGVPHAVVAWLAWRRKVTWLVLGPLLGSIAWTTFMMAKHGSGAHYWLEPTGLAVIAISRMPAAIDEREPAWLPRALPWAGVVFGVVVAITSWPRYVAEPARYRTHDAITEAVDAHCVRKAGEFVVSSDLGLELALNGRISVPAWQTGFLARTGKFPAEAWREDLARPEVRWLALAIDPRLPPGTSNDERVELSPFYDVLKPVVMEHYVFDQNVAGIFVFRRK